MLSSVGDSPWSNMVRHAIDLCLKRSSPHTTRSALHRAFAKIRAQFH